MDGGQLDIVVRWRAGSARAATSTLRRPSADRLLAGCTPAEALDRLPRLYALCGRAQTICARTAFAQLPGRLPGRAADDPRTARQARDGIAPRAAGSTPDSGEPLSAGRTIAAEMVFEHLWRFWLDWPRLLGLPQHADALAQANRLLRNVATDADAMRAWETIFEKVSAYFDLEPAAPASGALAASERAPWASGSQAACLLDRLEALTAGASGPSRRPPRLLPDRPPGEQVEGLRAPSDPEFGGAPTFAGLPCETGALARYAGHEPVVRYLQRAAVPAARVAARLLALLEALAVLGNRRPPPARWLDAARIGPDEAVASVETARGQLLHYLRMREDRVAQYRIVAPTEWNFHPQGAIADELIAAGCAPSASDDGVPEQRAPTAADALELRLRAAVLSLDPCVSWSVVVDRGGGCAGA